MITSKQIERFINAHPLARSLTARELRFALSIADKHHQIRLYRSRGEIVISREAMYTPGVREPFIVRRRKGSLDGDS